MEIKAVANPKKSGGTRLLGIPTVEDRIAQMLLKLYFKQEVELTIADSKSILKTLDEWLRR
ncbi:hypothetical protein KPL37_18390 [Clostridium frigoris]|uniref:Uncharacterized protein n=1 Tax=Clostridium frigoris TaxID=205327 RepID=A0ABS6BYH5_9CLOT|nr:hypothetical protein [Clostridium frigoris]MBU3161667.1 hypothetical protein [Clostridium frigoris]